MGPEGTRRGARKAASQARGSLGGAPRRARCYRGHRRRYVSELGSWAEFYLICGIGKQFLVAKSYELLNGLSTLRYYAGFADKISGKTIEVDAIYTGWELESRLTRVAQD